MRPLKIAEKHTFTVKQIKEALIWTGGIKTLAAQRLNCSWRTLYQYIKDNSILKDGSDKEMPYR